ncbi:MAG TPA: hypothetical protein PLH56_04230 [Candidatus Omnitrophota bacterium]|nr:hypothetical protein [Candidatus Omnitrophota bacterium]
MTRFFHSFSSQNILIGALICAAIFIITALIIRHWVILFASFALGGYLFTNFYPVLSGGHLTPSFYWPAFFIGGFIFSLFFMAFFELALVIVTSFLGAYMIFQVLPFENMLNIFCSIFLFVLGMKSQFMQMRKGQKQQFKKIDLERFIQENLKKVRYSKQKEQKSV